MTSYVRVKRGSSRSWQLLYSAVYLVVAASMMVASVILLLGDFWSSDSSPAEASSETRDGGTLGDAGCPGDASPAVGGDGRAEEEEAKPPRASRSLLDEASRKRLLDEASRSFAAFKTLEGLLMYTDGVDTPVVTMRAVRVSLPGDSRLVSNPMVRVSVKLPGRRIVSRSGWSLPAALAGALTEAYEVGGDPAPHNK